jgi:hypothetical protein
MPQQRWTGRVTSTPFFSARAAGAGVVEGPRTVE